MVIKYVYMIRAGNTERNNTLLLFKGPNIEEERQMNINYNSVMKATMENLSVAMEI